MGTFLIILFAVLDIIASFTLEQWTRSHETVHLILGSVLYAVSGVIFGLTLKYEGLAIANIFAVGVPTLVITILAVVVFKEQLTSLQIIGIALIGTGILLVGK